MNDSMINPSIVKLLEKVDNRYSLVVATSRRARQLIEGAEPSIESAGKKALTIAIDEVNVGNIDITEGQDKAIEVKEEVNVEAAQEETGVEEGLE